MTKRQQKQKLAFWKVLLASSISLQSISLQSMHLGAQEPVDTSTNSSGENAERLRFSFNGARWREVLEWLCEAGDLALHVNELPAGSFTYSDSEYFTVSEAISRLNLFLIPQGYVAVRRGRLLTVITLGDSRSLQQLDAIAENVTLEELEALDAHQVVKCFVPLNEINPADAIAELQPLALMTAPVSLPKSKQLLVTETVAKMRSVVQIISGMAAPEESSIVRSFVLKHVNAETVLLVAGGHIGIPDNETSGLDITITTDVSGKRLFAIGNPEKIETLEQLLSVLDVPSEDAVNEEPSSLRSHRVLGDNLQIVNDVLQTILADESIRLTIQPSTNSIVAFAPERVHRQIEQTIQELQSSTAEFAIVDLNGVDAYFAVSLIREMFGQSAGDTSGRLDSGRGKSSSSSVTDTPTTTGPRVDADPTKGRLFVRGTANEIEQIQTLVERLSGGATSQDDTRLVPLTGPKRTEILQAAKQWWNEQGRLQIIPNATPLAPETIERAFHENDTTPSLAIYAASAEQTTEPDTINLDTKNLEDLGNENDCDQSPLVLGQLVPDGIIIQSNDLESLDRLENYIRSLSDESDRSASPPIIYYLKYVTAEEAVKMLADLLDGANELARVPGGNLVTGGSTSSTGYYGSFLFSRDGVTTVTMGTTTIVSDARLNRLIVQGTAAEVALVERYLKIIDKNSSITDIETAGRTHIIELQHTKAADVAQMVRSAFPDRIIAEQGTSPGAGRRGDQPGNNNGESRGGDNERSSGDGQRAEPAEKPTRGLEPKMAIAIHEASNSIVITCPDALFEEVGKLIESIDQRSEQIVEVILPPAGVEVESILKALSGEETPTRRSRSDSQRRGNDRGRGQ